MYEECKIKSISSGFLLEKINKIAVKLDGKKSKREEIYNARCRQEEASANG